jgi:hypothetical protein
VFQGDQIANSSKRRSSVGKGRRLKKKGEHFNDHVPEQNSACGSARQSSIDHTLPPPPPRYKQISIQD